MLSQRDNKNVIYSQHFLKMRKFLLDMMTKHFLIMSNFYLFEILGKPNSLTIVTSKKIIKMIFFSQNENQEFAVCRDVFFEEYVEKEPGNFMAECSKCGKWCHRKCEVIPKGVFVKPNATWECSFCL